MVVNSNLELLEIVRREKAFGAIANLHGAYIIRAALENADLSGVNLSCASLRGANLRGANLSCTNLAGADLKDADLTGCNLYAADLAKANLRGANLTEADLTEAALSHADFYGADLTCVSHDWDSHDLIAEILRQAAGDDVNRLSLAAFVYVRRSWCWRNFLRADHTEKEWAIETLKTLKCPHVLGNSRRVRISVGSGGDGWPNAGDIIDADGELYRVVEVDDSAQVDDNFCYLHGVVEPIDFKTCAISDV